MTRRNCAIVTRWCLPTLMPCNSATYPGMRVVSRVQGE